jgi:hypothetical protein
LIRNDRCRLQSLCEVVQELLRGGTYGRRTSTDLFQPPGSTLRQQEMTMWMYPGSSCPDCPFSEELGNMEINTWIRGVIAHGAALNLGTGPPP